MDSALSEKTVTLRPRDSDYNRKLLICIPRVVLPNQLSNEVIDKMDKFW